ncbi:MAG: CtsR family transcriptional regulator [Fastidiosipilaceae bacterium]|jgi:transcriptional regulator CtsR|nr:CtsR family transcriptional regulator [Clostridiaceae bacterium]
MARLTDIIEQMIKEMIDDNDGRVEITRGKLAEKVNCVPSQITYVLSTRFTNGQGYIVESRRGGGGWIRISRIANDNKKSNYVMHVLNSLGDTISRHDVVIHLNNLVDYDIIDDNIAAIMYNATSDQALTRIQPVVKDLIRMDIFKSMLLGQAIRMEREEKEAETMSKNTEKKDATKHDNED